MDTTLMGRRALQALTVVLIAGSAAIGLSACQTPARGAATGPGSEVADTGQSDEMAPARRAEELSERFAGRPADRIEEELRRESAGFPAQPGCIVHHLVEHPGGDWHLICTQVGG